MNRSALLLVALCLAAAPAPKGPITSCADLITALPADLAPQNGAWGEVDASKAMKWFRENTHDQIAEMPFPLVEVRRERIASKRDPLDTDGWRITLLLKPGFHGKGNNVAVTNIRPEAANAMEGRIVVIGDDAMAKASEGWKEGEWVTVRGRITGVDIKPSTTTFEKGRVRKYPTITTTVAEPTVVSVGKWKSS